MNNTNLNENLLERVLENRFYAGAVYDYEDLSKFIRHPNFPDDKRNLSVNWQMLFQTTQFLFKNLRS